MHCKIVNYVTVIKHIILKLINDIMIERGKLNTRFLMGQHH